MRSILLVFGELCLTAVVVALFAGELEHAWHAPAAPGMPADPVRLVTGEPFAFIRIPAFGAHWRFTVVQGTTLAQLDVSPGHVPGTQLPG